MTKGAIAAALGPAWAIAGLRRNATIMDAMHMLAVLGLADLLHFANTAAGCSLVVISALSALSHRSQTAKGVPWAACQAVSTGGTAVSIVKKGTGKPGAHR